MPAALVLVYGALDDPRVDAQMQLLAAETDAARDRDVGYVVVERMPQAERWREMAGLGVGEFAVVLLEDDDGELIDTHFSDAVTAPGTLWAVIDGAGPEPG